MFENKTLRILFLTIALFALAVYFTGLPIDVTRDAGKYATISKEIFQNGNYINLTVHGDAYDQKPPLLFWLGAIGFHLGGISNFWFKFPVLILVIFGFYWAFRLGKSLYNTRVGYLTSLFLGFSFIYTFYSADIHTDTPLQALITLSLWQLYEFIKTRKNRYWITGFFAIGLAMLCKGPIGAVIPAFAVIGHILLKKDFRFLFNLRWFAGIILAFIVTSPALIGLMNQFGWEGIRFFFWDNNVGRITGSYVKAVNDPFFYVHNLLYLFLPWSLLFFASAFLEFKLLFKNRFVSPEYITLAGIWIFFIIINSASSQLPNYIFSIIPLIAVLTAKWTDIALDRTGLLKIFQGIQNVVTFMLWIFVFAIAFYFFPFPKTYYWFIKAIGIILSIYIFVKTEDKKAKLIFPSIIAFTCFTFLINAHVLPFAFGFQAPPKAARLYTNTAGKEEVLYNYMYDQYELFFYSDPQAIQIDKEEENLSKFTRQGNWIFTNPEGLTKLDQTHVKPEKIIEYRHLYLNRPLNFINPKTREESLKPMYLIKY